MRNLLLRTVLIVGALCGAVACGSSSTPTDASTDTVPDATGADTAADVPPAPDALDAPAPMDVAGDTTDVVAPDSAQDVATDVATDVAQDAPRDASADACNPAALEATMPMGVCDGRGMIACSMWAQTNAGGNPNATAVCVNSPSGCARADACSDRSNPATCTCGGAPACAAGSVCVGVGPTSRCTPIPCP